MPSNVFSCPEKEFYFKTEETRTWKIFTFKTLESDSLDSWLLNNEINKSVVIREEADSSRIVLYSSARRKVSNLLLQG